MAEDKVMRKIAALLSKTIENGATEQEAMSAAKKAQELIAKYHIDMREYSDEESINREDIGFTRSWMHLLATIVAKNMCCEVISTNMKYGKKYLAFIGKDTDRAACLKTYDMLLQTCKKGIQREKAKAKAEYGTFKGAEDAYARSFVHAVGKELGKQCRALVLVIPQEVEDKTSEEFPTIKVHRLRPIEYYAHTRDGIEDAKRAGAADGMDASMMRPIQHHE